MCTVLIQTSQMPASPVTVQFTTLKSALHGNATSTQCTHSHTPTTAALHSLSTHMSTKHVLFAIPRTIRTMPSLEKKKKKKIRPKILPYIFTMPWPQMLNITTKQTKFKKKWNSHTPYVINWGEKPITQVLLGIHGRCNVHRANAGKMILEHRGNLRTIKDKTHTAISWEHGCGKHPSPKAKAHSFDWHKPFLTMDPRWQGLFSNQEVCVCVCVCVCVHARARVVGEGCARCDQRLALFKKSRRDLKSWRQCSRVKQGLFFISGGDIPRQWTCSVHM